MGTRDHGGEGRDDPAATTPGPFRGLWRLGAHGLYAVERTGLVLIVLATMCATYLKIRSMITGEEVTISDLLLLFIYLEVVSMSSVYWRAHKLPVRMPLYIAMVALARYLMFTAGHIDAVRIVALALAILVLALAVLVLRFGHRRYPYVETRNGARGEDREDHALP